MTRSKAGPAAGGDQFPGGQPSAETTMTRTDQANAFWGRLLRVVDEISDPACGVDDAAARILAMEEGFLEVFDPADHYPEYVALLFCRAVRRQLEDHPGRGC